jgi:hypothetical protein
LLYKEINGLSIICAKPQAVHDHFVIDLARYEDLIV